MFRCFKSHYICKISNHLVFGSPPPSSVSECPFYDLLMILLSAFSCFFGRLPPPSKSTKCLCCFQITPCLFSWKSKSAPNRRSKGACQPFAAGDVLHPVIQSAGCVLWCFGLWCVSAVVLPCADCCQERRVCQKCGKCRLFFRSAYRRVFCKSVPQECAARGSHKESHEYSRPATNKRGCTLHRDASES